MIEQTPCPDRGRLQAFLLAQEPAKPDEGLEKHILTCRACWETARNLKAEDTMLQAMRTPSSLADEANNELINRVVAELEGRRAKEAGAPAGVATAPLPGRLTDPCPNQALLAPPQSPDELGRLATYSVLAELGHGGMGVVFRAKDVHLNRQVALKVMRPALVGSKAARRRFLREAQAIAALIHNHIVPVYHAGEDRGVLFLAMQLLQGESLHARLQREGRLSVSEILRIGREVAEALAAAHAGGVIHRDIKPENIWLEAGSGSVKVLDFGLAAVADEPARLTQAGLFVGTPGYAAPEQAEGESVGPRADFFSLGCVMYQMSTAAVPFPGATTLATLNALARCQPLPPQGLNPELPANVADLIMRLLAKDPAERPPSAAAIVESIAALERAPASPESGVPVRAQSEVRQSRSRLPLIAATLVTAIALISWLAGPALWNRAKQSKDNRNGSGAAAVDPEKLPPPKESPANPKEGKVPAIQPLAIILFEEKGAAVKDYGGKVTDLLFAKLAGSPDVFLVDREDLKKVLQELELNLSGAVKPEEAAKTGQLTGAKLLLTGSVFQIEKQLHIVAKIIGAETSRVVGAAVEGKADDELAPLVDKLAEKVAAVLKEQADKLVVKPMPRTDRIAALNLRLKNAKRPVLFFRVPERHVGQVVADPAAQTELILFSKGTGFDVIDPDEGFKGKADVVITGEGLTELAARRGGLVSVKARLEMKAVDRKTDKVLAVDRQTTVALDLTEQLAGKAALQEAAAAIAERLLPKLVKE
jgi:serine/threonine protein kinase